MSQTNIACTCVHDGNARQQLNHRRNTLWICDVVSDRTWSRARLRRELTGYVRCAWARDATCRQQTTTHDGMNLPSIIPSAVSGVWAERLAADLALCLEHAVQHAAIQPFDDSAEQVQWRANQAAMLLSEAVSVPCSNQQERELYSSKRYYSSTGVQ